ncbi:MAG TPA: TonB-dependent receptor, partial [Candidatus Acidoferrales bacterium]
MCNLPRLKAAILALVPLFLLMAQLSPAQSISGVIAGTLRDQQNQPLPGATITVTNRETGGTYQASSDENGHYRVPEITPGSYDVTVEFPGMQTVKHTEVPVAVDVVTLEDFAMKVAGQETTVEVKSTAPTTDTTDATLRYDFSTAQIQSLPILTRDINNLALLVPGTVSVRTFSFASTLVPFSANGSRGRDNNFIIDSVDNNEPLFGGAATQFTNTDVFAEFTVLTHQEDAEFGRNTGATVNVITKSGSNNLHGSAFWFGQDGEFNALDRAEKTALLTSPPESYENQAGATLGGPIKKDKSFYFLSYQWDLAHDDLSRVFPVLSTLPDSAGLATLKAMPSTPSLAAYLATPSVAQTQGAGGTCFTSPAPAGFNSPNPCLPAQPAVDGVTYNVFNVPRANIFDVRDQEASGRYDQKIGNRNDIYGRYLVDDLVTPDVPLNTSGDTAFSDLGLLPDARMLTRQRTQSAVLDHRFYGVKYLNELRFAYSRIAQGIGPYDEPVNVRNGQPALTVEDTFSSNGFGVYSNNFPSAGNRFTIGQSSSPSTFRSNIYQIQENFSLIHGRNNFKFGGDFVRTDSGLSSLSSNLGQYVFGVLGTSCDVAGASPTTCTGASPCTTNPEWCGLNSFLNGSAAAASVTFQRVTRGSGELSLRTYDEAVFFQDTVQLRPSLSIDAGIRYELFGQPINDLHTLYPQYVPTVNSYKKNFGPRIGFAYAPSPHLVVRGGYGIQYNPVIFDIAL